MSMDTEPLGGAEEISAPAGGKLKIEAPSPDDLAGIPWTTEKLPAGATSANWFSLFNAVSWQITLGSPVVLYGKSQGASETLLGVIAALTPLLVIFQLPAAHYLPRFGYRRFILAGWGSRTVTIFGLAAVPLLWFAGSGMKLALVVGLLFVFNLFRGIASGAWYPWISELIPEQLRGRFLGRDQIFMQVGCLAAMTMAAVTLSGNPQPWQFTVVFLISAVGATISLLFLKRMPDVTCSETMKHSGHRVPWMHMLKYPPFFRLMMLNLGWTWLSGGLNVFTVAFLKSFAEFKEGTILWLYAFAIVGPLCTVRWVGPLIDREGSKRVLGACLLTLSIVLSGWWLVAAEMVKCAAGGVAVLYFAMGMAMANYNVANNRLMMATMPPMGRNHFFALFTVITSLSLGLSPIAWGVMLDLLGAREWTTGVAVWNRYSVYFALVMTMALGAMVGVGRLHEGREKTGVRSQKTG